MEDIRDKSLKKAMEWAKIYSMPEQLKPNTKRIWAMAFIEVAKFDCSTSFCVAENDGEGNPHILRDFGSCSKIVSINGIYPYDYLKKSDMPDIKKPSEVVFYLVAHGHDQDNIMALISDKKEDGTDKTEEELTNDIDTLQKLIVKTALIEYNKKMEEVRNEKERN